MAKQQSSSSKSKTKIKLGLVQTSCTADVEANVKKTETKIRVAAKQGANIVCLQELFAGLYFCQAEKHEYFGMAESIPGPTTTRLGKLAGELGIVLIAPSWGFIGRCTFRTTPSSWRNFILHPGTLVSGPGTRNSVASASSSVGISGILKARD
jgi:hypothetical protein